MIAYEKNLKNQQKTNGTIKEDTKPITVITSNEQLEFETKKKLQLHTHTKKFRYKFHNIFIGSVSKMLQNSDEQNPRG